MSYGYREDVGTLRPAKRMADGRLRADALITRPGVFEYADPSYPGGIRRELRPRSEVFNHATLDSFAQVPVTHEHPPMMLTAENAQQYMVGSTGETVQRVDDHIATSLMIADARTIAAMEAGKTEVSCGYKCRIDETPGVDPEFGEYHVIQRDILGNHLAAAIDRGRAGRTARVRMDAELTDLERSSNISRANPGARVPHGGGAMDETKATETIRALSAQLKSAEDRADTAEKALKATTERADKADGTAEVLTKQVSDLQAQIQSGASAVESDAVKREKTRADSLQQQVNRFDDEVATRVQARCKVLTRAASVMDAKFRMDDLDDDQIRRQVLKRLDSSIDIGPAVSAAKIEGMFDLRVDDAMKNARSIANASDILVDVKVEGARKDTAAATPPLSEAWKQPLPNSKAARGAGKGI